MAFKARSLIHALFGFSGRAKRLDYWLMVVGLAVVRTFSLSLGLAWMHTAMGNPGAVSLRVALDLLFFWPSAAIVIRRGDDRNRPALYSVILVSVLYGLGVAMGFLMDAEASTIAAWCLLVQAIGSFYMLIDYGLMEGTKGRNRYGPSPKGYPDGVGAEVAEVFD